MILPVALVAFAFGLGGYTFFAACKRCDLDWSDREAVEKTPLGPFYSQYEETVAWAHDHGAREISVTAGDGVTLSGWWIPAKNARGTMLLVHGYHSCGFSDFSAAIPIYHQLGMNILLPCHRAHGKSGGKYITYGVLEHGDMQRWIAFHNENLAAVPVMLSGLSMGAATVLYLADQPLPLNVKGIIADCGFTSPKEIIAHVFTKTTKLPAWTVMWAASLFARFFGGFSLSGKHTVKTLANSRLPVLMIHGAADDFVPCDMTRRGYAACKGDKKLMIVEGATHGVSFYVDRENYIANVKDFLRHCLKEDI